MPHLSAESDTTALFPVAETFAGTSETYLGSSGGVDSVVNVIENWHNDVHAGAFPTCQERPCHAVRRAVSPLDGGGM